MATGTKLMKEISDQFLVCKICLEPFKEPKTLSCLHTFCLACIQQQYDTESNRPTRYTLYTRSVTCPMCRKKTELPTGGVRRLPDNFLVSNLTEVLAKKTISKVPPCEICHTVQRVRSNDACSKCLDCDKLLCRACVELHSATKVTQDHGLIDIEGQKDIECKEHPEETVRFYCERCDACICVVCTFQEHKDHDVCSFSDGFSKHKVTLETLLGKSKERLTGVAKRLKVIEQYEVLSKELKERIRDLAISYTSQVRAKEKELIRKVDDLFSGSESVSKLAENKPWLQESFDSLQSACNLTEIVMKDKGVEMLLLKKEIQGKLNSLLQGQLPPEPPDVDQQLDIKFVPGEVQLGDVVLPGEEVDQELKDKKKGNCDNSAVIANGVDSMKTSSFTNGVSGPESKQRTQNGDLSSSSSCSACKDCQERKKKEEEEDKTKRKRRSPSIERDAGGRRGGGGKDSKLSTKSVYVQTKPQEEGEEEEEDVADGGRGKGRSSRKRNGHFTTTSSQVSLNTNAGVTVASSSMQTPSTTVSSSFTATESASGQSSDKSLTSSIVTSTLSQVAERKEMRTLKIQTEESCLRDSHLSNVASSSGSTYPFTGAAIAAAFLRHSRDLDDVVSNSASQGYSTGNCGVEVSKETQEVGVATDVTLGLSSSVSDIVAALSQGGVGVSGIGGPPDLLAQTTAAATASSSSTSSASSATGSWVQIRSRKSQTDITAVTSEEDFNKSLFGGSSTASASASSSTTKPVSITSPVASPSLERARAARAAARGRVDPHTTATVSKKEVGVMTPFNVKIVPESTDKQTSPEVVTSRDVELMTLPETRSLYIQTRGPRLTSTGMGTDREGQMSKSTTTLSVLTVDSETAMPQVTQESRVTWTEAVPTSERATATEAQKTNDAATLTATVRSSDFGMQMRPQGVSACTNTMPPHRATQQCQTTPPGTSTKSTMPDPALLTPQLSIDDATSTNNTPPSPSPSPCHSPKVNHRHSLSALTVPAGLAALPGHLVRTSSRGSSVGSTGSVTDLSRSDKATETVDTKPKMTTRAAGPSTQMQLPRTVSTDTLHLTQVADRETCTPQVKTVDEWTHTPQPQMINTGVTPPRPATIEVGVATNPTTLMDQATYTEVKTLRESATETCTVVCDSETLTEKTQQCDAQTEAEPPSDDKGTGMEVVEMQEDGCMTDDEGLEGEEGKERKRSIESRDSESQCLSPTLVSREINTTRVRKKAKEIQTPFSYVECQKCQHPEQLQQQQELLEKAAAGSGSSSGSNKTFTDTSTDPSPPNTQDVGTMALSCQVTQAGMAETGVQTSSASLYDKGVATSFEWDDDFIPPPRSFLGLECADAATSTESLPYIGLLSEIDVDELIVIPQANFELVNSDYDSDYEPVEMVDGETWTGEMDIVEQGTQTLVLPVPVGAGKESAPTNSALVEAVREVCAKNLVSVGVNTLPKVTFEKETCTPIRHLFSKGTMTFYVAKMDKATSTISHTRTMAEQRFGGAVPGMPMDGRMIREARPQHKDNKVTMTTRKEQRDMAVETEQMTPLDGRITQCISKLRNVSERLNSPTLRKHSDGEIFFGQSFAGSSNNSNNNLSNSSSSGSKLNDLTSKDPAVVIPQSAPRPEGFPKLATGQAVMNLIRASPTPPKDRASEEEERQKQLHSLLAETDAVLRTKDSSPAQRSKDPSPAQRSKDPSPVRKAQPITTLKPRTPVVLPSPTEPASGGGEGATPADKESKSLPRQRSLERPNKVKMGSGQPSTPSSIPLLRYDSAPGSIPTVPAQTLLGAASPQMASPRASPGAGDSSSSGGNVTASSDSGPDSDSYSTTSSQKMQQRPALPSISETRASASPGSDTSFISHDADPATTSSTPQPPSSLVTSMTSSHSRTPSNVTSVSDTASDVREDSDALCDDSSSVSSASTTLTVPGDGTSPGKQKKEKKGFMQRLLSVKKKKDSGDKEKDKESGSTKQETDSAQKQPKSVPPSPKVQPKKAQQQQQEQQGAKPKTQKAAAAPQTSQKSAAGPQTSQKPVSAPQTSSQPTPPAVAPKPVHPPAPASTAHGATPASSRPSSSSSTDTKGAESTPPMAPHHYPPLPDPNQAPPPPRKPRPFVYVRQRMVSIQQDNVEDIKEKKEEKEEKGKQEEDGHVENEEEEKQQIENEEKKSVSQEVTKERKVEGRAQLKVDAKVKDQPKVKGVEVKVRATLASAGREKLLNGGKAGNGVSREKLAGSVSREKLSSSVSRERLTHSVSKERLAASGASKEKQDSKGKDVGKPIRDSKSIAEKSKLGGAKVVKKVEKGKAEKEGSEKGKKETRSRTRDWICGK